MANKRVPSGKSNVVRNNAQPIKKKRGCLSCLLTVLIVFVVIIGAAAGAGYYFGDKLAKENLDMSLKECFGVLSDLTKNKPSDIITNPYSDTGKDEILDSVKKQLFLKESVVIDSDKLFEALLGGQNGGTQNEPVQSPYLLTALNEEAGGEGAGSDNPLMGYISSLYAPENIDKERLRGFDESLLSDYIMNFSDKELAAFVGGSFETLLKSEKVASSLEGLKSYIKDKEIKDLLALEQIIFYEEGESVSAVPHIKATLSADLRSVANPLIKEALGIDLSFLVNMILPKRIYVTVDMELKTADQGEPEFDIYINNMDDEKMARLYKLVFKATELADKPIDLEKSIDEAVSPVLVPVSDNILKYGNVSDIKNGNIKLDLFETVISAANLNEGKTDEQILTSTDIMYALKYVITSEFNNAVWNDDTPDDKRNFRYNYVENATGDEICSNTQITEEGFTWINYQDEFLNELAAKYLLDLSNGTPGDTSDDITFNELMKYFGIGADEGVSYDFQNLLNTSGNRLGDLAKTDEARVVITDRMMGAMLHAQVSSLIQTDGSMASMAPQVYQVKISVTGSGEDKKVFLEAGLALDISSALGGAGGLADILNGIIPAQIMLGFKMEVTPQTAQGYEYAQTQISYNDLTSAEVENLLNILSKFGVELGIDEIKSQLEAPVRGAISEMNKQMPAIVFEESSIKLGSIFDVVLDKVVNSDGGKATYEYGGATPTLTSAHLKDVIAALYDDSFTADFTAPDEALQTANPAAYAIATSLKSAILANPALADFCNIASFDYTSGSLDIVMQINTADMFGAGAANVDKIVSKDSLYVFISFDLTSQKSYGGGSEKTYASQLTLNDMSAPVFAQFNGIVKALSGVSMQLNEKADTLGNLLWSILNP